MREIKTMNFINFIFAFGDVVSKYAVIHAAEIEKTGGSILVCLEDEEPVGCLLLQPDKHGADKLMYVYTCAEFRNRGVFNALFDYVISKSRALTVVIGENAEEYQTIMNALNRVGGFYEERGYVTFGIDKETGVEKWQTFMKEKGDRIIKFFKRRGFETVSFEEAGNDVMEQVRTSASPGSEFENALPVSKFFAPDSSLDKKMSFATTINGKLAAYSIITSPQPGGVVFEQISTAKRYRSLGVAFTCVAASADRLSQDPELQHVSLAVINGNDAANAFRESSYNVVVSSVNPTHVMRCKKTCQS